MYGDKSGRVRNVFFYYRVNNYNLKSRKKLGFGRQQDGSVFDLDVVKEAAVVGARLVALVERVQAALERRGGEAMDRVERTTTETTGSTTVLR